MAAARSFNPRCTGRRGLSSHNMRAAHGLVIGKFWPPHAGHHHLIRTAAATCEHVSVVVMAAHAEGLPLASRMAWLADAHRDAPEVRVLGIHDDVRIDYADSDIWRQHVALMHEALRQGDASGPDWGTVTAVFTSETYGEELARHFSAKAVTLDLQRENVPVSGKAVRADLLAHWQHLAPATRAGLAKRVVVIGAESTGTTTLSRALTAHWCARGAPHHETRWIGEYGRDFTIEASRTSIDRPDFPPAGIEGRVARAPSNWRKTLALPATISPLSMCFSPPFGSPTRPPA